MTESSDNSVSPASAAAILLIIFGATSFVLTDGPLRLIVGGVCMLGLLVCVSIIARTR